jgi:hypothetical protein
MGMNGGPEHIGRCSFCGCDNGTCGDGACDDCLEPCDKCGMLNDPVDLNIDKLCDKCLKSKNHKNDKSN